jgi:hypothetical protein
MTELKDIVDIIHAYSKEQATLLIDELRVFSEFLRKKHGEYKGNMSALTKEKDFQEHLANFLFAYYKFKDAFRYLEAIKDKMDTNPTAFFIVQEGVHEKDTIFTDLLDELSETLWEQAKKNTSHLSFPWDKIDLLIRKVTNIGSADIAYRKDVINGDRTLREGH